MNTYVIVGTGGRARMYYHAIDTAFAETSRLAAICDVNQTRMDYVNQTRADLYDAAPVPTYKFNQFTETDYAENDVGFCNADFTEFQSFYSFKTPRITPRIKRIEITGPKRVWTAAADNFYLGRNDLGYEIWIYDMEGNVQRKIRKEYNPVPIPEEFKTNYMARIRDGNPIKDKIYFPDNWPPFQHMFVDKEGRLFVMTYEPGPNPGDYIYDIFNSEGAFIARTSLANRDDRFPLKAMAKRDRIYSIRVKENGYKELVVHRMVWE